ncbi:MAG: flagellin [Desulfohalobiaceae bacterium]|nr:flagellin [Desulfohalobiaceae bacterium]
MALTVNTNVMSLNAQRNLNQTQNALSKSMERLSSGLRINSAKDDAAGLAISDRMTSQIRGLNQAVRNANDGISLAQTGEGAMQETTNILQRMRELSVQSANDTNTNADRASLQSEVQQLQEEIDRIAETTTFNGKKLLDGSLNSQNFHVGANSGETINFSINSVKGDDIGVYRVNAHGQNLTVAGAVVNASGSAANAVSTAGSLTFTGNYNGDTFSETADYSAEDTAKTIASSINNISDTTGITADAQTKIKLDSVSTTGSVTFDLYGKNSSAANISVSITDTGDLSTLANAINEKSVDTGISAVLSNDKASIDLVNADGEDIQIADYTSDGTVDVQSYDAEGTLAGSSAQLAGTTASGDTVALGGYLQLDAQQAFSVSDDQGEVVADGSSTLSAVNSVEITSQSGADSAIKTIDSAIAMIDAQRGDLGAVQNRFESTIANLQNVSENLSSARSRILDADIAQETSAMTKNNVLQQAGVSILAQANQAPQIALSLLQ